MPLILALLVAFATACPTARALRRLGGPESQDLPARKFGRTDVNVLMIAICCKGIAYPILWQFLPKAGNSNTAERKALMERYLRLVPAAKIKAFPADREFIGEAWLKLSPRHGCAPLHPCEERHHRGGQQWHLGAGLVALQRLAGYGKRQPVGQKLTARCPRAEQGVQGLWPRRPASGRNALCGP